jgi:hypothetical protein
MNKKKLRGRRCQCPSCSEYMNSLASFDMHRYTRTGSHFKGCYEPQEMEWLGMTKTADGFWTTGGFENVPWSKTA